MIIIVFFTDLAVIKIPLNERIYTYLHVDTSHVYKVKALVRNGEGSNPSIITNFWLIYLYD